MQQFSYVKGKNATDIALVIEAMDLLHSGEYDAFCLVSSDSDFASLAVRIRKNNLPVYGFGKSSAVDSFKHSCSQFFVIDEGITAKPLPQQPNDQPANKSQNQQSIGWSTEQLQKQTQFIKVVTNILQNNPKAEQGWSNIGYLASQLNQQHPELNLKKYGYKKFSDLMIAFRLFDIKKQGNILLIKSKNLPKSVTQLKPPIITPTSRPIANKTPVIVDGAISLSFQSSLNVDMAMWRLTSSQRVRGDMDIIFYGQTHSEDNSIELDIQFENHRNTASFHCLLNQQPNTIEKLVFTATCEDKNLSQTNPIIVSISKNEEDIFSGEFIITDSSAKSVILLELIRNEQKWQVIPKKQTLQKDLRDLCDHFGVEVAND